MSNANSSTGSCSKTKAAAMAAAAQYNVDAQLISAFDRSREAGTPFDYSKEVHSAACSATGLPDRIPAYLDKIQRGGLVQPFGLLLCIDELTFSILAFSENAHESLGPAVSLGADALGLFAPPSAASLAKAVPSKDLSLLNPIWVQSVATGKHLYAILHRVDVGIVIDLEPALASPGPSIAGAVQSQKLAARVISRLQSLACSNDAGALCEAIVENVRELTGYDRVMVYKFHEDEHGEVVAEVRRPDLDSYLGLHYPATDIPQAARFLFKQNKVRMICNCNDKPVRVVQDDERMKSRPLCLVNSTIRAPHGCHSEYMANMGSVASLAMAVVFNESEAMRLWGLVVCHHTAPRYLPFPLRYACEFVMQAFALQLNMVLQLAAQVTEKKTLRTQALLCDMLMRDGGGAAVTSLARAGSPNITDLVRCDGAALHYKDRFYSLGVTPSEAQMRDIVLWLLTQHRDSTGLSTESLAEAGYPGAAALGDEVCGMASARISSSGGDFILWFRSHTAKEIRWGGAKHHPEPEVRDDDDDGGDGRMHPRLSFNAFLEVVKSRSLPWEVAEMNAIHSLQLITREVASFENAQTNRKNGTTTSSSIGGGAGIQYHFEQQNHRLDELSSVASEMVRLIETATVPVIAVDCAGLVNGWNAKAAELTGLPVHEAMGKSLAYELVHHDARQAVGNQVSRALQGYEDKGIELKLRTFGLQQKEPPAVFIVANACSSKDYMSNIVGVCFVGQDVTRAKVEMDKFVRLQGDYQAIVQSLNPLIPPLFTSDENTCCSEWNAAMETLSGWKRVDVVGKMLLGEIFGGCCVMKDQDALTKFKILLYEACAGQDVEKAYFGFYNKNEIFVETMLSINKRTDIEGNTIGCICFLQTTTPDLQQVFEIQRQTERKCLAKLKQLAYLKQEIKNPLNGVCFTSQLLDDITISDKQREFIETTYACGKQIMQIIQGLDIERIENGSVKLDIAGFNLGSLIAAVVSQAVPSIQERNLDLQCEISEDTKRINLYGDQVRFQQILADFLVNIVRHSPDPGGWVGIDTISTLKLSEGGPNQVHLQLRMTHPGRGFPLELIQDMFDRTECATHEGLALNVSRKLLRLMNGDVQYAREADKCYFLIDISFPIA